MNHVLAVLEADRKRLRVKRSRIKNSAALTNRAVEAQSRRLADVDRELADLDRLEREIRARAKADAEAAITAGEG